jgi:hypothetical protein
VEQAGAELLADPEPVCDRLDALGIEVGPGQIALAGVLVLDAERHFSIGVGEEHMLVHRDAAALPVRCGIEPIASTRMLPGAVKRPDT